MKTILCISFFIFISHFCFSQTFVTKHYTTNDGLPSSEIYFVFQDSRGFIWFATNFGVSRFDGYYFKNFDNSHGLPDNTIFEIFEDYKGRIWFISYSCKLSYFYNDSIYTYKYNQNLLKHIKQSPYSSKSSFYVDKDESVYIGISYDGLYKIDKNGVVENTLKDFKKYPPKTYIQLNQKNIPCVNSNNFDICINTVNVKIGNKNFDFKYKQYKGTQSLRLAALTSQNHVLFSETNYLYDIKDSIHIVDYFFKNRIIAMYNDTEGSMWIGFYKDGVKMFKNGKIENGSTYHFLKEYSVSNIIRDKEGGLWFTTLEDGVYYVPSDKFHTYTVNEGLTDRVISSITYDGENIWAASDGLLKIKEAKVEKIEKMKQNNFYIYSLFFDNKKSSLWIGGNYSLINLNVTNKSFNIINDNLTGVNDISRSDNGTLWFCTPLKIFTSEGQNIYIYENKNIKNLLKIKSISSYNDSCLFIGSMDGLWNLCNGKFNYLGYKNELLKKRINRLRYNKYNNTLYIGTKGQGLILMQGDSISQIDTRNGLLSNLVTNIFITDSVVWVATDKGLNRILFPSNRNNKFTIESVTHKNGLISNEINSVYVYKSLVFVGTNSGITFFDYRDIKKNTIEPDVYIMQFKVMDSVYSLHSKLDFKHDKNFITISFVGLNYRNLGNIKYKYKLEGASEEWIETDNTTALFPSLSYGKYRFIVYACNESGLWNKSPAIVQFTIHPPFWRTWWFYVLIMVLLIISIFIFIKRREHRLKQEKLLLEHKVQERTIEVVMQKEEIEAQRDEITEQKRMVDEINKDITDSIIYAKNIQKAIFPEDEELKKIFPDSFIFFKPRDIVSGDFYWFKNLGDYIFIAAADCTGHGVPGAFMSMLGIALLNEIAGKGTITEPDQILNLLRDEVIRSFQHGNQKMNRRDGMDISLIVINKTNLDANFSGANNPIYIISNTNSETKKLLTELKADKMPIGYYERMVPFTKKQITLHKGDYVYMFSDGYADQFGGSIEEGRRKKFMYHKFKKMISDYSGHSMEEQKQTYKRTIIEWMGYNSITGKRHEQVDDILLLGFKI